MKLIRVQVCNAVELTEDICYPNPDGHGVQSGNKGDFRVFSEDGKYRDILPKELVEERFIAAIPNDPIIDEFAKRKKKEEEGRGRNTVTVPKQTRRKSK